MPSQPAVEPKSSPRVRIAGLDVLRGVAVALVILQHAVSMAEDEDLGAGIVGVVMFFALSGYLITGVLLNDVHRGGRVRYRTFYRKRGVRLLPALVGLVGGYLVIVGFNAVSDSRPWLSAVIALTYTADVPRLQAHDGGLYHLWTLATEEQFYLLWPLVLTVGARLRRIGPVTVVAFVLAFLAAAGGLAVGVAPGHLYALPTSWGMALVVGAMGRVFESRLDALLPGRGSPRSGRHGALAAVSVLLLVGAAAAPDLVDHGLTYLVLGPAIAAAMIVLVFWTKHWTLVPSPVWRPVLSLGTVSYAVYLWNLPLTLAFQHVVGRSAFSAGGATLATLAAATLSWWLIEKPVSRWAARRWSAPTVTAGSPAVPRPAIVEA